MKMLWTTIKVNNMDESLAFYSEVLGLNINVRAPIGKNSELAFLGNGETTLELIYDETRTTHVNGDDISIGFSIDSVIQWLEKLEELKIPIHMGPMSPSENSEFFFILDPNGVPIQLVENK